MEIRLHEGEKKKIKDIKYDPIGSEVTEGTDKYYQDQIRQQVRAAFDPKENVSFIVSSTSYGPDGPSKWTVSIQGEFVERVRAACPDLVIEPLTKFVYDKLRPDYGDDSRRAA